MRNTIGSIANSALNNARLATQKINQAEGDVTSGKNSSSAVNGPGSTTLNPAPVTTSDNPEPDARSGSKFLNTYSGIPSGSPNPITSLSGAGIYQGIPAGNPESIARLGEVALQTYPGMPSGAAEPDATVRARSSDEYSGIPTSDPGAQPEQFSTEVLNERVEELNAEIDAGLPPTERTERQTELNRINNELEHRSLDALENHLVETENTSDNVLTNRDIERLAKDSTAPEEVQQAAQFYLDNPDRFRQLATQTGKDSFNVTIGDIHTRQLDVNVNIDHNEAPLIEGDGSYTLPDGDESVFKSETPQRDQITYRRQQNAIEAAIRTGDEVEFVNSDGQAIPVSVEKVDGPDDSAYYEVTVGDESFSVESEIGIADTISGISNIIEFGSTIGTADGIRQFPDSVRYLKAPKTSSSGANRLATYSSDHRLTFNNGNAYIEDAELYFHELGHGIGNDLDGDVEGEPVDASPAGWADIHNELAKDPDNFLSDYSNTNDRESFAEAFAAYSVAKSHGEEALQEFREAFPVEAEYLDNNVFGVDNPPS